MTVLVQDPMKQLSRKLLQLTQETFVKSDSCGVILSPCSHINSTIVNRLQTYLHEMEPELSTHCFFDHQLKVLGIVLKNRGLAGAHYTSLICKEFLERHDLLAGEMVVASFPESGQASLHVLSQLFDAVSQAKGAGKEIRLFVDQPEKTGVSSILVADTEEVSREFIKLKLELKGYEVYEAKDGSEALEKFEQLSPDLVITELNLPIVDGYQLIHKIKEGHDGKVIVLTDKHLTKDMNRAFELGASDYVTKPFSFSELEWRIKKLQTS